jgi:hypothetical protein
MICFQDMGIRLFVDNEHYKEEFKVEPLTIKRLPHNDLN